jgi:hypothetical protein
LLLYLHLGVSICMGIRPRSVNKKVDASGLLLRGLNRPTRVGIERIYRMASRHE